MCFSQVPLSSVVPLSYILIFMLNYNIKLEKFVIYIHLYYTGLYDNYIQK